MILFVMCAVVLFLFVLLPMSAYLCVRMGTRGYLREWYGFKEFYDGKFK